jgi:hypothetical protein
MTLAAIPFINSMKLEIADVLGYSSMVLSALLVFFGIRWYREHAGEGGITFGRGFAVGLLITLVSCACYAVAFEIIYFKLVPDFGEKFAACMVERVRASGGTPEQIDIAAKQAQTFKRLFDNPATNAALTFATWFPLGLVVTASSAAVLRKR